MKKRRIYETLQEWMEATGTNATKLAELARIDRSHMVMILKRSRRCSYEKALRLSMVTGVPVENLIKWMVCDGESHSAPASQN